MPSNFTSATPRSAFWVVTGPSGAPVTVLTTGGAFIRMLESTLKGMLATPRATYDGTMVSAHDSGATIDGNWGPWVDRALWAVTGSPASREIIRIAASIGAGSSVPRDVVQIAANLVSALYGTNAQVPADAIGPLYRRVSPGVFAPFTSRPSTAAEIASVSANPSTLPPEAPPAPPAPGPAPAPTPTPDTTPRKTSIPGLPSGVPNVQTGSSSISWGAVAAVAAGVVVLGVIAVSVRSDQKRGGAGARGRRLAHARANPRLGYLRGHQVPWWHERDEKATGGTQYLGVYEVSRHYGGPEEGGWWYDRHHHVRSVKVKHASPKRVNDEIRRLRDSLASDQPRFGIGSAANRGEAELRVYRESRPGDHDDSKEPRPHYE